MSRKAHRPTGEPSLEVAAQEDSDASERVHYTLVFKGVKRYMNSGMVTGVEREAIYKQVVSAVDKKSDVVDDPLATLVEPYELILARLREQQAEAGDKPSSLDVLSKRITTVKKVGLTAVQAETVEERDQAKALIIKSFPKGSQKHPARRR
jgi:hypothetical protein